MSSDRHVLVPPSVDRGGGSAPGVSQLSPTSPTLPIAPDALDALKRVADESGLTLSQAIEQLVANNRLTQARRRGDREPDPRPARLSVNINKDTNTGLHEVARERGVTITEAVRRLIGYGMMVYRANRDGHDILLRRSEEAHV